MDTKKSFIAYYNWGNTFNQLPDDKAGQLIKHLFAYVRGENPKTDDILINAVFENMKDTIDRDYEKYSIYIEKQKKNGKKGGRPPKEAKPLS